MMNYGLRVFIAIVLLFCMAALDSPRVATSALASTEGDACRGLRLCGRCLHAH
jgi:hypothetical protein